LAVIKHRGAADVPIVDANDEGLMTND